MALTKITAGGLADNSVVTASVADSQVTVAKTSGVQGVTDVCQFRTTGLNTTTNAVPTNWEVADDTGTGTLGSAVTHSSGIFSFPTTGHWLILFYAMTYYSSEAPNPYVNLEVTIDNSDYGTVARCADAVGSVSGDAFGGSSTSFLFDVTNTTNCKVRFTFISSATAAWSGNTGQNHTHATFIRMGDT